MNKKTDDALIKEFTVLLDYFKEAYITDEESGKYFNRQIKAWERLIVQATRGE